MVADSGDCECPFCGRGYEVVEEPPERLGSRAIAPGLDESRSVGHVHAARVREDFMGGVRSGVNGTPTFFINGWRRLAS